MCVVAYLHCFWVSIDDSVVVSVGYLLSCSLDVLFQCCMLFFCIVVFVCVLYFVFSCCCFSWGASWNASYWYLELSFAAADVRIIWFKIENTLIITIAVVKQPLVFTLAQTLSTSLLFLTSLAILIEVQDKLKRVKEENHKITCHVQ